MKCGTTTARTGWVGDAPGSLGISGRKGGIASPKRRPAPAASPRRRSLVRYIRCSRASPSRAAWCDCSSLAREVEPRQFSDLPGVDGGRCGAEGAGDAAGRAQGERGGRAHQSQRHIVAAVGKGPRNVNSSSSRPRRADGHLFGDEHHGDINCSRIRDWPYAILVIGGRAPFARRTARRTPQRHAPPPPVRHRRTRPRHAPRIVYSSPTAPLIVSRRRAVRDVEPPKSSLIHQRRTRGQRKDWMVGSLHVCPKMPPRRRKGTNEEGAGAQEVSVGTRRGAGATGGARRGAHQISLRVPVRIRHELPPTLPGNELHRRRPDVAHFARRHRAHNRQHHRATPSAAAAAARRRNPNLSPSRPPGARHHPLGVRRRRLLLPPNARKPGGATKTAAAAAAGPTADRRRRRSGGRRRRCATVRRRSRRGRSPAVCRDGSA